MLLLSFPLHQHLRSVLSPPLCSWTLWVPGGYVFHWAFKATSLPATHPPTKPHPSCTFPSPVVTMPGHQTADDHHYILGPSSTPAFLMELCGLPHLQELTGLPHLKEFSLRSDWKILFSKGLPGVKIPQIHSSWPQNSKLDLYINPDDRGIYSANRFVGFDSKWIITYQISSPLSVARCSLKDSSNEVHVRRCY